jgi:hypothetical protein
MYIFVGQKKISNDKSKAARSQTTRIITKIEVWKPQGSNQQWKKIEPVNKENNLLNRACVKRHKFKERKKLANHRERFKVSKRKGNFEGRNLGLLLGMAREIYESEERAQKSRRQLQKVEGDLNLFEKTLQHPSSAYDEEDPKTCMERN